MLSKPPFETVVAAHGAEQANSTPARILGFAYLANPDLVALTTPTCLSVLSGATATGGTSQMSDDHVVITDPRRR